MTKPRRQLAVAFDKTLNLKKTPFIVKLKQTLVAEELPPAPHHTLQEVPEL
jgi:hypothetical protein